MLRERCIHCATLANCKATAAICAEVRSQHALFSQVSTRPLPTIELPASLMSPLLQTPMENTYWPNDIKCFVSY